MKSNKYANINNILIKRKVIIIMLIIIIIIIKMIIIIITITPRPGNTGLMSNGG